MACPRPHFVRGNFRPVLVDRTTSCKTCQHVKDPTTGWLQTGEEPPDARLSDPTERRLPQKVAICKPNPSGERRLGKRCARAMRRGSIKEFALGLLTPDQRSAVEAGSSTLNKGPGRGDLASNDSSNEFESWELHRDLLIVCFQTTLCRPSRPGRQMSKRCLEKV